MAKLSGAMPKLFIDVDAVADEAMISAAYAETRQYSITPRTFESRSFFADDKPTYLFYKDQYRCAADNVVYRWGINTANIVSSGILIEDAPPHSPFQDSASAAGSSPSRSSGGSSSKYKLRDALWKFAKETNCYYTNDNNVMWEHEVFNALTQEKYYRRCLIEAIKNQKLPLYGIKKFCEEEGLQKIPIKFLVQEKLKTINIPDYDTIFSAIGEVLYTDISIKSDKLDILIRQYKDDNLED